MIFSENRYTLFRIMLQEREIKMAEADLDGVIRSVAKKQIKMLVAAARKRHRRLIGQAAKSKSRDAKARFRDLAKSTLEFAAAAARRLEITADNAADSYMRSMKRLLEEQAAAKAASEQAAREKATREKAAKANKAPKKSPRKTPRNKG
jgi:hypothetical protein